MRILTLILLLIASVAGAQFALPMPPDTVTKHDTAYVALYQVRDTTITVYIMSAKRGLSCAVCHVVFSGFKQQTPQGMQWVKQPELVGIYDTRWKKLDTKRIVKIL